MNAPFVIVCQPRNGFYLLQSLMDSTSQFPTCIEWREIEEGVDRDKATNEQIAAYLESIRQDEEKCGLWGVKADSSVLPCMNRYFRFKGIALNDVKWIWLYRENMLKAAISECTALRKDLFWLPVDATDKEHTLNAEPVEVDLDSLGHRFQNMVIRHEGFRLFFKENGIQPLIIRYEDFIEPHQWKPIVLRVMKYFNVPYVENGCPITSRFLKQSNDIETDAIIRDFLESSRDYIHK